MVYLSRDPVVLSLGTWRACPSAAVVYDLYAYSASERSAGPREGGMLGADFLIAHGAVVDFGSRTLYLH